MDKMANTTEVSSHDMRILISAKYEGKKSSITVDTFIVWLAVH